MIETPLSIESDTRMILIYSFAFETTVLDKIIKVVAKTLCSLDMLVYSHRLCYRLIAASS